MALNIKTFRVNKNRFITAAKQGFYVNEQGFLKLESSSETGAVVFTKLDSGQKDHPWGRMKIDMSMQEDGAYTIYVFASDVPIFLRKGVETKYDAFILDEKEPFIKKIQVLELSGAKIFRNHSDLLLTGIVGRYVWFGIHVWGSVTCEIRQINLYNPGDLFLKTFPEIYRTQDGFFQRYLSVFSSLYADFDRKISGLTDFVDVDTAPAEVLPSLAKWLGIEVGDEFLGEEKMRLLLKNAYRLSRMKGTRKAITEVAKLLLDEEPFIVEQSAIGQIKKEDRPTYERLYSSNPLSFSVFVYRPMDERLYAQLTYLIDQFKPVRSTAKIIFLDDAGNLDTYCYLGVNAKLMDYENGTLNTGCAIGQNITLG